METEIHLALRALSGRKCSGFWCTCIDFPCHYTKSLRKVSEAYGEFSPKETPTKSLRWFIANLAPNSPSTFSISYIWRLSEVLLCEFWCTRKQESRLFLTNGLPWQMACQRLCVLSHTLTCLSCVESQTWSTAFNLPAELHPKVWEQPGNLCSAKLKKLGEMWSLHNSTLQNQTASLPIKITRSWNFLHPEPVLGPGFFHSSHSSQLTNNMKVKMFTFSTVEW